MLGKDSFYTVKYKGHYIHGHHDRTLKREAITIQIMDKDGGFTIYDAKSLHAAKCKISRIIGGQHAHPRPEVPTH